MFRLVLSIASLFLVLRIEAATFTILNSCAYTVWPGILSNAGVSPLTTTGFALRNGESKTITTPSGWGGRFWGRTLCSTNSSTGLFSCQTADCGSGSVACNSGAAPPATLAEFTLDGSGGLDFFDVSLVDGYNLPMVVTPHGGPSGGPNCTVTGCFTDVNSACPSDLRIASLDSGSSSTVACKSACDAFNSPQYCCSGAYGSPDTCKPSSYSMVFKKACPTAYSYAYDDKSSTFTCGGSPDYTITFCASPATRVVRRSRTGPDRTVLGGPKTILCKKLGLWTGAYLLRSGSGWTIKNMARTNMDQMDRIQKRDFGCVGDYEST